MTDTPTPTPRELLGDFGESYAVVRDARRELADLEAIDYTTAVDDARRRLAYLEAGLLAHADRVIDQIEASVLVEIGEPSPAEPEEVEGGEVAASYASLADAPVGFYRDKDGDVWEVLADGQAAMVVCGDQENRRPAWAPGSNDRHRDRYGPFVAVPKPEILQ